MNKNKKNEKKELIYFLDNNLVKNGFIVALNDNAIKDVLSIIDSE